MATVEALKDPKDIELIKMFLKQHCIRDFLLFITGCNTGLRIGDILRLRVSDLVVGEKQTIKKHLIVTERKTGKVRQIAINGTIQRAVKLFISTYHPETNEFLFISRKGDHVPISTTQAYRLLNDAARACKIDVNFGTHSMRKTWGYFTYIKTGNNIGLLMDLLGHSSARITLRYIGLNQLQKDAAYMLVEI